MGLLDRRGFPISPLRVGRGGLDVEASKAAFPDAERMPSNTGVGGKAADLGVRSAPPKPVVHVDRLIGREEAVASLEGKGPADEPKKGEGGISSESK